MATKAKATTRKAGKAKPVAKATSAGHDLYRAATVYKSPRKIVVSQLPSQFSRADLEFIGVDHSGASYEARVYVNNPTANAKTDPSEANGYAGSYYIFGHGGCFGDVGHCEINRKPDPFDFRQSHPLEPIKKIVIATEAIKQAMAQGTEITVTVVPLITSWSEKSGDGDMKDVMKFDHINLVTYD